MLLHLQKVYDFIFPPSDDELQVRLCNELRSEINTVKHSITVLSSYADPRVKACIHLAKFHNHQKAKKLLGEVFKKYLDTLSGNNIVLVPIPLSNKRERERGYNQVTEVLRLAVKTKPDIILNAKLIKRTAHTSPQTSLKKNERQENIKGAFAITTRKHDLKNKHVILIDDVTTTGSTMMEAYKTINSIDCKKISCVALAH